MSVIGDSDRFVGNLVGSALLACWTEVLLGSVSLRIPGVKVGAHLLHVGVAAGVAMLLVSVVPRIYQRFHRSGRSLFTDNENGRRAARRGRVMGVFLGVLAGTCVEGLADALQ